MAPPSTRDIIRYKEVRRADTLDDQKTALQILAAEVNALTQEQLQEFILSQIKRIIHGDNAGYWRDNFAAAGISSLEDLSRARAFYADCLSSDVVGTAAYVTGPSVLGFPQVTACDVTTPGKYPAIGIITAKVSSTRCLIQAVGEVASFPSPLTPGKTYFVGLDAFPTETPPAAPLGGRVAIQTLGIALDDTRMLLSVTPVRFIRSG